MEKKQIPTSNIDYDYYFSINKHDDVELSTFQVGILNVTSGKIVVCDPLVFLGKTDFLNKTIKPGKYPVTICISNHKNFGEQYSFAKLIIKPEKVIKWELAFENTLQEKISDLKEDEYFGFPVDAGLGCFCDYDTQKLYKNFIDEFRTRNIGRNIYDSYFAERFKANAKDQNNPKDIGNWLDWNVPNTENNVIMFNSGGDGYYPVYWGLNEKNDIISLLIDFQVLD